MRRFKSIFCLKIREKYSQQPFGTSFHFYWVLRPLYSCLLLFLVTALPAQNVYFSAALPGTNNKVFWQFNPNTCELCVVFDFIEGQSSVLETLILPNGDVLIMTTNGMQRFNPPSNTPLATIQGTYTGGFVHPNDTIYLNTTGTLYTFDPVNNTVTTIGDFPSNYAVYELFFYNGQLYGMAGVNNGNNNSLVILQINLSNPSASVPIQNPPPHYFRATSAPNGTIYVESGFSPIALHTYDFVNNTVTQVCGNLAVGSEIRGLTVVPLGTPELDCTCLTMAGTPAVNTANSCIPVPITVAFNGDAAPDYNDIIRYILFSDPNDPLGTIIQNNASPAFPFLPPLQANVNYYVAQVVGNNLNGNFDPLDPCIAISTAVPVIWRPRPTVASLVGSGTLCAGSCQDISITLSGTPPFTFSWEIQQNGVTLSPLELVFNINDFSTTFQACVPANANPGQAKVVICSVSDIFCFNP